MPKWSEPGNALPRTNYEVSGTEAAEAAVHLALTHTKRRYIITFSSSFHGMGIGTKVLSGLNGSYGTYLEGWGGGVIKAPYPYSERIPAGMSEDQYTEYCLWYLDNHIPACTAARDNIAGILVEPGLAEGGNWIPSTRFLSGIRDICDKNDWLMISDEVLTGLGRTGRMWGIEHYGSVPKRRCGLLVHIDANRAEQDDVSLFPNPCCDRRKTDAGTTQQICACCYRWRCHWPRHPAWPW